MEQDQEDDEEDLDEERADHYRQYEEYQEQMGNHTRQEHPQAEPPTTTHTAQAQAEAAKPSAAAATNEHFPETAAHYRIDNQETEHDDTFIEDEFDGDEHLWDDPEAQQRQYMLDAARTGKASQTIIDENEEALNKTLAKKRALRKDLEPLMKKNQSIASCF